MKLCRNGLHDVSDPANIYTFGGGKRRTCRPCVLASIARRAGTQVTQARRGQTCAKGHLYTPETSRIRVSGRRKYYICLICSRTYEQQNRPRWRSRQRPVAPGPRRWPVEPILPFLRRWEVGKFADKLAQTHGTDPAHERRQISRILSGRLAYLTDQSADKLAIGLGLHPINIWGDEFMGYELAAAAAAAEK